MRVQLILGGVGGQKSDQALQIDFLSPHTDLPAGSADENRLEPPGPVPSGFGTVRPRVQIPGPRPKSEYDPGVTAHAAMAMDHSWITISSGGLPALRHGARISRPNIEPGL